MKLEECYDDINQQCLWCYINMIKQDNIMGCGSIMYYQMLNLIVIWKLTMPVFTHLVIHKKNKNWFKHQQVVHQL